MDTFSQARHSGLVLLSLVALMSFEIYMASLERQFEYKSIADQETKKQFLQGWRAAWYSKQKVN